MYDPGFALALTLAVFGLISTPFFRVADEPPTDAPARRRVIDGLRGFAALGVFLHHAAITHDYVARGVWQLPPSRFFSMAGQVGVAVFFLITGYLFWGKLLRERGRPNWIALYGGRVFRIGPIYAIAIVGLLVCVAALRDGRPVEGAWQILGEVARWSSLGMFTGVPIDGDRVTNLYLAGVVWSLQYEWAFYAALLVLAVGARREDRALPFTAALAGCCVVWWHEGGPVWLGGYDPVFALLFVGGMACASLERRALVLRTSPWILSVACLTTTVAVFALFPIAYGMAPTLLLTAAFYMVVSGGDVFGLLRSVPARRLGDISFGVYMLQGLVLTAVFHPNAVRDFALAHAFAYWAVVLLAAVVLISSATAAHRWIERPGIRGGHRFLRFALSPRRGSPARPGGALNRSNT